ncbi:MULTISPECIES: hypothetical protein [unclassified Pantoea]|nr:hypothetical protein [Pantoea sp.]
MEKSKTQHGKWQQWLSFSAFTLAGVALEGSHPPAQQQAPKAKKWRTAQ